MWNFHEGILRDSGITEVVQKLQRKTHIVEFLSGILDNLTVDEKACHEIVCGNDNERNKQVRSNMSVNEEENLSGICMENKCDNDAGLLKKEKKCKKDESCVGSECIGSKSLKQFEWS